MADTFSIELDIAGDLDTSLASMLHEVTKDYESITYRIVNVSGPGGGWPIVRFVGEAADMFGFVTDYCGGDPDEAKALLEAA